MSSVVWYKHIIHVKSVKKKNQSRNNLKCLTWWDSYSTSSAGEEWMRVQKKSIQVRTWQSPLRQPSRQGLLDQPGRAQCLPQSPCQPIRLKESKPALAFSRFRLQLCDPLLLCCDSSRLLPFFRALSMSFSRSRACLFPGSFLRSVRMYFRAFSYS